MSLSLILAIILVGVLGAGLGTMVGLGGGVFIVPALAVVLGVDLRAAIAAGAICVVLNSLNGSSVYLKQGMVNLKLAMVLLISTVVATAVGALVVIYTPVDTLKVIFGAVLGLTAIAMVAQPGGRRCVNTGPDPLGLEASYDRPTKPGRRHYVPQKVRSGIGLSGVAGLTAGMLGIGGGAVHVPIMNSLMRVPLRAAVATSTFMVGLTGLVSALIYTGAGLVDVAVTVPAMGGILIGSQMGSQMGCKMPTDALRNVLIAVLVFMALAMVADGFGWWTMR